MPVMLVPVLLALSSFSMPPALKKTLDTGAWDKTPAGFRIIALSHIADGCAAQVADNADDDDRAAARRCVAQAFALAMKNKAAGTSLDSGRQGVWLSHLALILGDGDATGPCLDTALHERVVRGLAKASLADPLGHTSSFANKKERWPADQAVTLAAIHRFDIHHGTDLTTAPLAAYGAALEHATDAATGLPWSEMHGLHSGKLPRGCALSYSVRYLSEVDVERAARWWAAYKTAFFVDRVVVVGFREWPPGINKGADIDSGPIVQGVGAAATAFAIAAARAMDDDTLALRLEATAGIIQAATKLDKKMQTTSTTTLATAIRFQGAHQNAVHPAPAAKTPTTMPSTAPADTP